MSALAWILVAVLMGVIARLVVLRRRRGRRDQLEKDKEEIIEMIDEALEEEKRG